MRYAVYMLYTDLSSIFQQAAIHSTQFATSHRDKLPRLLAPYVSVAN